MYDNMQVEDASTHIATLTGGKAVKASLISDIKIWRKIFLGVPW